MAYTSSALSFLLEDLGKTVVTAFVSIVVLSTQLFFTKILTGAQIPLSQLRNDAVDNLMGALTIAGHYIIPGTSQGFSVLSSYWFHILTKPFLIIVRVLCIF